MKSESHHKAISNFNAWFDEATPRFRLIFLLAGIVSILLTLSLFLQTALTKVKPMPVRSLEQENRPNIIFIIVDALSANDMSMFGYSLPTTPNLDEITRTWTVYSNTQSPLTCTVATLPTLMTGRYTYTNLFRYYGDQIATQPGWLSIPNALEQNGYQTWWSGYHTPGFYHMGQVFQKNVCRTNDILFVGLSRSWFKARAISKSHFPFIPITLDQLGFIESWKTDFDRCGEIVPLDNLLQNQSTTSPFFIYYHYNGVHGFPYPSGESLGKFLPVSAGIISEIEQRKVYGAYKLEDQPIVDMLHLRYDEAIADQDQKLTDFIESLKQQGLYDSAMIIITSDHGQSFSNGYTSHCTPLVSYAEAHVPLLIKYPYQAEGQRFDFLVSTIDIAPTILEVAGIEYPDDWFDGISLLKQDASEELNRIVFTRRYDYYYYKYIPSIIAATDGRYRLVRRNDEFLLFDPLNDPLEKVNLLEQGDYRQMPEIQRLLQALDNYRLRSQWLISGKNILTAPQLSTLQN
jgi:arylsulfatase A-like enzyme